MMGTFRLSRPRCSVSSRLSDTPPPSHASGSLGDIRPPAGHRRLYRSKANAVEKQRVEPNDKLAIVERHMRLLCNSGAMSFGDDMNVILHSLTLQKLQFGATFNS